MNPSLHPGRRTALAKAPRRTYGNPNDVLYTDAALYTGQAAALVSLINSDFNTVVTASVRTIQPVVAEKVGIALAIVSFTKRDHVTIRSDSQAAIKQFCEGRVSPRAFNILRKSPKIPNVELV
ncbi:hypothetical protein HPB47_017540 [Ixodes persulcatus]|uniref:Uncharacterized protein n=1 Tax=Ixodes persulcatus TaxID=34615 RepID=A0AC60QN00_IXOPE|nr:hypothetical protein HPB47_017540 [Ixodes persulcatus]